MANSYMGNMTFGVNFKVDTHALDVLDTKFSQMSMDLKNLMQKGTANNDNGLIKVAKEAQVAYDQLYIAMNKAYNPKLGQFDLSKVNASLQSAGTNLTTVASALNGAGQNVNGILSTLMGNKLMIKETNQFLDKMAVTFGNTVRWSITNKIINTITGSIQKAFYFTKDLDRSLNDIRIVTGKSADEMERFARQATSAAQALGKTTTDYTKASLLYYQQGLSDQEVAARTQTTLKAANVTGQSTSEVSEQLTAVWNGYKVSAAETEKYIDKLSAVAASTASNLEELSTGMSKVASAANMMGVDIDQLNAQLSTVISVTRQAPETIGAAFKTIYARMSTINAGGIDEEDGATLKSYTEKMNQFGISVLDSTGHLRDMGDVIEEIGGKWESFTREQQTGLAQAMGGTRQYSNITALFENWDKYQAALKTSQEATGTLQKQQDIYMDSIEAHFKQLTAEAENFYQTILDEDVLKDVADGFKFIIQEINAMVQGLGGGRNALIAFGTTVVNLFSNQIGKSLGGFINQQRELAISQKNVDTKAAMVQFYGDKDTSQLTRKQRKIYSDFNAKDEQQKLQDQFFNTTGTKVQLSAGKADIDTIKESNNTNAVLMSNKVLKEQAQNESKLLNVAKQLGSAEYNKLTTLNSQLAVLKSEKEQYDLVNEKVKSVLETSESVKSVSEIEELLENETLKTLENQRQELQNQIAVGQANNELLKNGVIVDPYTDEEEKHDQEVLKVLDEKIRIYKEFQDLRPQVQGLANGTSDDVTRRTQLMQNQINGQVSNAQVVKNTQTAFRVATGVVKAATAAFGGLQVALDKSKTSLERVNGGWEGLTGAITGGIMAVNPAVGMLVGGVLNLGKSILDATGLTKTFADWLKTDAERLEDSRQAMIKATEAAKELNQKVEEQQRLTQSYNSQVKSIEALRKSWDDINNKLKAHINLTTDEQIEYENLKEQLADANADIIEGYDSQHNIIISNNNALQDTLDKLQQQYELQLKINGVSLDDRVNAYNDIINSQKQYEENYANLMSNSNKEYLEALNDFYYITKGIEVGQVLDLVDTVTEKTYSPNATNAYGQLGAAASATTKTKKVSNIAEGSGDLDSILKQGATGVETVRVLQQWFGTGESFETILKKVTSTDVENIRTAVENADSLASGHGSNKDDINDLAKTILPIMEQAAKWNEEVDKTDANAELEQLKNDFIKDFDQTFRKTIQEFNASSLVRNMATQYGANIYSSKINRASNLTADDLVAYEEEAKNEANLYLAKLQKNAEDIDKAAADFGKLELQKTKLTIEQYSTRKKEIYKTLEKAFEDENNYLGDIVLDGVFGKDNSNINDFLKGKKYYTTTPYGSTYESDNDLKRFLNTSGAEESEVKSKVMANDEELFVGFMQQFTEMQNGNISDIMKTASNIVLGSNDWEDLWEGYQEVVAGRPSSITKMPELTSELDEIKNLSLEGSALDEEKFDVLVSDLDRYRLKLSEVGTELDILTDKELYGTQVWYESLQRVEQELQKAQEQILLDERKQIRIDIIADGTIAKEELDDLLNQDYKIIADIEIQHKDAYDTAVKEVENLQKALSYVGEEGKVAAENVLDLLNAFPELNDMITELNSDGSISLTKEQIELIKQRTQVDINGTIAAREMELQTQLNRVQQEKKRVQEQITLTENSLRLYKQGVDNKEAFEEAFLKLYAKYNDTQEQITEENNDAISTDSWQTADAVSKYWVNAYNDADTAYKQFVDNVVEGNAVLRGDAESWTHHDMDVSSAGVDKYKGEDNKTDSQKLLDEATKKAKDAQDSTEEFYNQVLLNLRKEMESLGMTEEEIENEMLSLHAIGLKNVDDAKNLGKKTEEAKWQAKDLYDYYHKINKELEFINNKMDILQKKQKLMANNPWAELEVQKQITKALDDQITATNTKLEMARGYTEEIKTRKTNASGKKGLSQYGLEFDENGNITNYADVAKALQEGQNSQESVEDYENFDKEVKAYEEELKRVRDLEAEIYDLHAKRNEAIVKTAELQIEVNLDVKKASKQWLEFAKKHQNFDVNLIINPDQTSIDAYVAEFNKALVTDGIDALPGLTDQLGDINRALEEIETTGKTMFNGEELGWENYDALVSSANKTVEAIEQTSQDITDAYRGTVEAYTNALTELNKWDKQVLDKLDMVNSVYDHASKLTSLIFGEKGLASQAMLVQTMTSSYKGMVDKLEVLNQQVSDNEERMQQAKETGDEEAYTTAYNNWVNSQKELLQLTEQIAQKREEMYEAEIDYNQQIVEFQMFLGHSYEEFENHWELINKQAEVYLDTINAQFGVTQLENKYLQARNKMVGNTKAQEKINKIMNEEMKMLKEKDKLTKYDLERAEAKYDLTLKQIALEEARENKTNLRLRRDSQGNYTYQYTANEDDILKAQNDVDIARNNLYNIDKDNLEDLTQKIPQLYNEMNEKIAQAQKDLRGDPAAMEAAIEEIKQAYVGPDGIITSLEKEIQVGYLNFGESAYDSMTSSEGKTLLTSFEKLTEDLPAAFTSLTTALDPLVQSVITSMIGDGTEESGIAGAFQQLVDMDKEALEQYQADVEEFVGKATNDEVLAGVVDSYQAVYDTVKGWRTQLNELVGTPVSDFLSEIAPIDDAINNIKSALFTEPEGKTMFNIAEQIKTLDGKLDTFLKGFNTKYGTLISNINNADFKTLSQKLLNLADLFGNKENGLIKRINDAFKALKDLVNPDDKVKNLNEISKAIKDMNTALKNNKTNFTNAEKAANNYFKTMKTHAQTAKTKINDLKEAINKLPSTKTITIKTVHVSDGGGGGKTDDTPEKVKLPEKPETKEDPKDWIYATGTSGGKLSQFKEMTGSEAQGARANQQAGDYVHSKTETFDAVVQTGNSLMKENITWEKAKTYSDNGKVVYDYNTVKDHKFTVSFAIGGAAGAQNQKMTVDEIFQYMNANRAYPTALTFDTGGYTGVWGDQGKLAMLHEKELVLNKEDTEHILEAVDLIRQIDMKKMQMDVMNNYLNVLSKMGDAAALEGQPAQINQTITINADFPDATDRDEIKAAFDNLVNLATQRALTKH